MDIPLIVIAGATATGKSDIAIALADRIGGEIINADALQFYRGMDIGTAKTPPAERRGIPHHLLDVLDVTDEASVAQYQRDARARVHEIRSRGRVPIAVGGSGLYLRALTDEIRFPPTDPAVRRRLELWAREVGSAAAHRTLAEKDPSAAQRIQVGDARRIVRALEVIELTGEPFTAFLPSYTYDDPWVIHTAIRRDRDDLHQRVERRVHLMAEQGLLDEVRDLIDSGITEGRTARQAIGYAQMLAHLRGDLTWAEAIDQTITGTRRLVRKQDTWFRRDPRITWIDAAGPDPVARIQTLVASGSPA
ncbi:tRNA (adenosine(37)-N6)-dimethylallyltransferase MiaA [Helcobacillus massiliensis]|uniref:tRNA (adenosine(37)-N6)-dimethylallyltransferase MiaA n=1 Tax=Helcobacillus massiliensis TaxID=521392 RepID=UPI00255576D4|nr:tRNA (adenosine(37)-N6)-dimethylallyltransferase MiaA [Helcobacillus massiliensis]MDK7742478.1 tRNA (adenosine(37)-N6)-dimethylallyltransferase MiaA [Helcobacillus massiliensis]WOO93336.1 tRNA (adenosine(37)-N6)-dimethylallyltransferase MiaA [Helcobacillus massiliensis]